MRMLLLVGVLLGACAAHAVVESVRRDPDSERSAEPDNPGDAMEWRSLRWRSEDGEIAPRAWERAWAARARNVEHHRGTPAAGIGRSHWVAHGPDNVGGRTRSLLVSRVDPDRMWAGAVGGGLWASADAGRSWTVIDDFQSTTSICCLEVDPNDPDVMYAGTGEGFHNGDAQRGDGIYKSTDGGATWARMLSTAGWTYTNRIAVSPTDSNLLLASIREGGVMRSIDGGTTWTNVVAAFSSFQVAFDPYDPRRVVAQVMELDETGRRHRAVYSSDGGATWQTASGPLADRPGFDGRIELAWAPSAPGVVYATSDGDLFRSTDGGRSFVQRPASFSAPFPWYCSALWVDPTDADFVVIGQQDIFKTTDGGDSITRINRWTIMEDEPHADVHGFLADPRFDGATQKRLYVVTDGGVYATDDVYTAAVRSGWYRLDRGYRTTQFYGAAGHGPSGLLVGGTQDNGTLRLRPGSADANLTFGGDGGFCAVDPLDPSHTYGEYVRLQIHRSTDGGDSARYIYQGIADAGRDANFIAPFVLDPNDPRRLLAGGISLWRTDDARASTVSWQAVKPPTAESSRISAIAVAAGDPDTVWVGHNDGSLFTTSDGTAAVPTWIAIDDNAAADPLPDRFVGRILVDTDDHSRVHVGFGGFEHDNLWRSRDGGASWVPAVGAGATALPPAPVNGLAQHPTLPDRLYVASEVGVFATADGGLSWSTSNDGPANTAVDEVVFLHESSTLLAATHGRGLWTIDVHAPEFRTFGVGCAGSNGVPRIDADTARLPRLGEPYRLVMRDLPRNRTASLVWGASATDWNGVGLPLELGFAGMPGCTAWCSFDVLANLSSGDGATQFVMQIPDDTRLLDATFFQQLYVEDPGTNPTGIVASNAIEFRIGY